MLVVERRTHDADDRAVGRADAGAADRAIGEPRFRSLVEQLPLSVYIDRLDDRSSNIYTSPQIELMLGYTVAEWAENEDLFVELLHPEDRERVLAAHHRTHATGEPLFIEYRLRTRDGRYLWVQDEARVVSDGERQPVLQGYLLDVTARKDAEEQLRHQAFHDALTGLANRALFTNRVEHALVLRSQLARAEVAVLFLDLDDFKGINDTLGHAAGDTLLRGVGVRLRDTLSPSYTVARLGGDEFAVLIEELAGPASAVDAAERLVAGLQKPFELEGREVFVTASVGIALGTVADDLLRAADVAMYRAKASGKAQYAMYVPTMAEDLVGRLELVAELRRARREEFVVHYQPLVDLERRAVVGVEALVRWAHPTRGLLQPGEFISLAEETGKIVEIGAWVLGEACAQVSLWRAETRGAADLTLNVNVSTRQVRPGVLVESVRAALAESGLPPEALTLELTESVLARRHEELRAVLTDVAALGVRLALDDFGTGYSSLSLLQDLPVHTLKVDRSFVSALDADTTRQGFVQAIVDLAHTLDVALVAEGMETAAETSELQRLGCRAGQGFHFAPPLVPDEVGELLGAGACASLDEAISKRDARAAEAA